MLLPSEVQGTHMPNNGEGITLEDLYQLIKSIPVKIRRSNYIMVDAQDWTTADVIGLSFAQSDQAEPHEFKVHMITTEWR